MTRARVRLAAGLVAAAAVVALTGCGQGQDGDVADVPACYPPLACGPFYPVAYYPYTAHPYIGLLVNPAHTLIVMDHGAARVTYKPYAPPLRPAYRATAVTLQKAPPPAAKTAPKPAPAKPAPRPATGARK